MKHLSRYSLTDPDVIAANQRGEITPEQRVRIRFALNGLRNSLVFYSIFMGILVLGIFGILVSITRAPAYASSIYAAVFVIGVGSVLWIPYLVRVILTHRELSAGQIEQTEGQVVWRGQNYIVEIPGRRLRFFGKLNLLPDDYRFLHLPHTGWLLSAERLTSAGEEQTMRDLLKILAQANHFSLKAIAANHAGRLADDQIWRLVRPMMDYLIAGLFIGCMALGALYTLSIGQRDWAIVLGGFGALGLLMLGVRSTLLKQDLGAVADVRARQIAMEMGIAKAIKDSSGETTSYYYEIHRQCFHVSRRGYNALVEGIPYRLHYAPHSKTMVSIEPLAPLFDATGRPRL